MAALAVIVAALARASWRDLRSLGSIAANNMLLVVALIGPGSAFFVFLAAILFLFPLSADVLRHLPAHRLQLWPLSRGQRAVVSLAALILNPMLLVAVVLTALTHDVRTGFEVLAITVVVQAILAVAAGLLRRLPQLNMSRAVPRLPGKVGGIIQNQMRQLMGALDLYFAAVLTIGGTIYRFAATNPDPMAKTGTGIMVVVFMSTLAQCQLGFDAEAELDRYRLMPLTGIEILFAKDVAWFVLVLILTVTLDPLPCLGAAAIALAVGHHTAAGESIQQSRWRFASGRLIPTGVVQIVGLVSTGVAVHQWGAWVLLPLFAAYGASLWWYGRRLHIHS